MLLTQKPLCASMILINRTFILQKHMETFTNISSSRLLLRVVLLGNPLQESLKVPHKPFGEGGMPWQALNPNPSVLIFDECFGFVEGYDNRVISFR